MVYGFDPMYWNGGFRFAQPGLQTAGKMSAVAPARRRPYSRRVISVEATL
jgi:hypothetical protein